MWLENEKNTWKLFYALYKNRLHFNSEKGDLCVENDLDIMKSFFENDNSIREVSSSTRGHNYDAVCNFRRITLAVSDSSGLVRSLRSHQS